jgi:hypothetical protein
MHPASDLSGLKRHSTFSFAYEVTARGTINADAGAIFGSSARATQWEMAHYAGGAFNVPARVDDAMQLWDDAAHSVF